MTKGLDGRHRDVNGEIDRKHGNTKMKTLKQEYPEFKHFHNETRLHQAEMRYGANSLDELRHRIAHKRTK